MLWRLRPHKFHDEILIENGAEGLKALGSMPLEESFSSLISLIAIFVIVNFMANMYGTL